jgi:hypothetical protein
MNITVILFQKINFQELYQSVRVPSVAMAFLLHAILMVKKHWKKKHPVKATARAFAKKTVTTKSFVETWKVVLGCLPLYPTTLN